MAAKKEGHGAEHKMAEVHVHHHHHHHHHHGKPAAGHGAKKAAHKMAARTHAKKK